MYQNSKSQDIATNINTIVDIQGFTSDTNIFMPKEIAIQCNEEIVFIVIKPQFPYSELSLVERLSVDWIQKYRQIFWDGGFVEHRNYMNCIEFLKNRNVYVKGYDKANWLRDVLSDDIEDSDDISYKWDKVMNKVHNLEDYGCPSFTSLYKTYNESDIKRCAYHPSHCAFTNVQYLIKWSVDHKLFD